MTREELLARTRRELWAVWALSSEEMASQAADTLYGLGMLVEPGDAAELVRLRREVADLRAERHTTNKALADVTVALRDSEDVPVQGGTGTLAAWLYKRFVPVAGAVSWESLTDGDRAYWEHQARAVQRAVEQRGGSKTPVVVLSSSEPADELPLLTPAPLENSHDSPLYHAFLLGRDLPFGGE